MKQIHSFAPVLGQNPRLLILGSMPSQQSLAQQRYYANPRNAFWNIMAQLIGFDPNLDYEKKLAALICAHIALWDVLKSCARQGSLDSNIKNEKPNNIQNLLQNNPICALFLNGNKAAQSFYRYIDVSSIESLSIYKLPSTSPAHARLNQQEKYRQWNKAWRDVNRVSSYYEAAG